MAGGASNFLENKILDHVLRVSSYSQPSALYVALYTTDPGDGDSGTEVSGGSYARVSVSFGAASNGTSSNSAAVEFPTATASWGTIVSAGIRDASTGGNLLFYGSLTQSVTIGADETLRFPAGNLTISID